MLALSASTATTGPGCGGMTPCMTDRHASSGSANLRKGWRVSWVRVSRMGSSRTRPTANQVVRPIANASAIMHHWMRLGPKIRAIREASTSAPPDSAKSFPSMVPKAMTPAVPASVAPRPSPKDFITPSTV